MKNTNTTKLYTAERERSLALDPRPAKSLDEDLNVVFDNATGAQLESNSAQDSANGDISLAGNSSSRDNFSTARSIESLLYNKVDSSNTAVST